MGLHGLAPHGAAPPHRDHPRDEASGGRNGVAGQDPRRGERVDDCVGLPRGAHAVQPRDPLASSRAFSGGLSSPGAPTLSCTSSPCSESRAPTWLFSSNWVTLCLTLSPSAVSG